MKFTRAFVAILSIAALTACDDENGTGNDDDVVLADLAGEWTVQSMTYEGDDSAEEFDLAAVGMGITELNIASDGSFDGTLIFPTTGGPQTVPIGGEISISDTDDNSGNLAIDFDEDTEAIGLFADEAGTFSLTASGSGLTVVLPDVTFPPGLPGTTAGADADLTIVATS